jgi:ketopantoate reductase
MQKNSSLTIIGDGRVGSFLGGLTQESLVIRRGEPVPNGDGPIIVCTRNDDLEAVLHQTPKSRHSDLVFVQNGMLNGWLQDNGIQSNTQALLYFAISQKGDKPVDGGETVVTGKWATDFQRVLNAGEIHCSVVNMKKYKEVMAEKFLWICTMGVMGSALKCGVGEIVQKHPENVRELCAELGAITEKGLKMTLADGWVERLEAYSLSIPSYQASLKEWSWRNGWLWEQKNSPIHHLFLKRAKVKSLG